MQFQSSYATILSSERLEAFQCKDKDSENEVIARYLWNIALCESLYPSIHLLEVTLRNRIHQVLSPYFGEDWLFSTGAKAALRESAQQDVLKVISRLQKDKKAVTTPRIIAGLSLGFWVFLFSRHYDFIFWRKNLASTFPNLPKKECRRSLIQEKLLRIWHLRNRVSHHEPIWNNLNLRQDHDTILWLIASLSQEMQPLIQRVDRFQGIYDRGWQPYAEPALL
jgi:hypothetical protein